MRKKNKNSRHGFTMIELLGAMVIIGILATIGIVSAVKVLDNAHKKFDEAQGKILLQAGQDYFTNNKKNLPTVSGEKKQVNLDFLINSNYIEKIYGYNKKEFNKTTSFVTVKKVGDGKYQYEYKLCYDAESKKCIGTGEEVSKTSNNSTISFLYKNETMEEDNILYTNDKVITTVTITKGSKDITGYKYEVITKSNKKQVKTSEIIDVGTTGQISKEINLSEKDYKDDQYLIRVTSYDTDGAAKSIESDKTIFVDTEKPTCTLKAPGENIYGWRKENTTISFESKKDDSGSGVNKYGIINSTSISYNEKLEGIQSNETSGTRWYGYVQDKAGNEGQCDINIKLDKTAPKCSLTTSSFSYNNSGWWNNPVGIMLEENNKNDQGLVQSGIDNQFTVTTSSTAPKTFNNIYSSSQTEDTNGTTWYGYVKDKAGNVGNCNIEIKLDTAKPTCDIQTPSGGANASTGWWTTPGGVTVEAYNFRDDTISNIQSGVETYGLSKGNTLYYDTNSIKQTQTDNTTDAGQNWTCYVKDKAGNEGSKTVNIKLDNLAPTCALDLASSGYDNATGYYTNDVTVSLNNRTDKAFSGIDETFFELVSTGGYYSNVSPGTQSDDTEGVTWTANIKDKAGNPGSCSVWFKKKSPPPPNCPTITANKIAKSWTKSTVSLSFSFDSTVAGYDWSTNTNGGDWGFKSNNSPTTTSKDLSGEGKRMGLITVYNANNVSKQCTTDEYWIDKTAPIVSATAKNASNAFSKDACNSGDATCTLLYDTAGEKYRGVHLTANNDTGNEKHSGLNAWGAQADYKSGDEGCKWGDGIDYEWSGSSVCTTAGDLPVKRCYKVKDNAGNASSRVCTCEKSNGTVSVMDDISKCW